MSLYCPNKRIVKTLLHKSNTVPEMSTCHAVTLTLLLLALAVTPSCRGEDNSSEAAMLISAIKGVSDALVCLSDVVQQSMHIQRQNTDSLRVMATLPDEMLRIKEQLVKQNNLMDSMKTEISASGKVDSRKATANSQECKQHQKQQQLTKLVQEFNKSQDSSTLSSRLETLLDHDTEVYSQLRNVTTHPHTPLWWVAYEGHMELASLLLCAGLHMNTNVFSGDTMLHAAAQGGRLQMVRLLLDHGQHVDTIGNSGRTPLLLAAYWGHLDVALWLVWSGANTSLRDVFGYSALDMARRQNHAAVTKFLQQLPH